MEEITGSIEEIIFRNEENGYTVAVFNTEEDYLTVVGNLPRTGPGMRLVLSGEWKEHPKYGEQFLFSEFEQIIPESEEGIYGFLASGVIEGVGPAIALSIVEKFGADALDVIAEEPEKLLEITGIGKKKLQSIKDSYSLHMEFAKISIELRKYGISSRNALKLFNEYGSATLIAVKENPYRLAKDIRGFGFREADKIAMEMGIDRDSELRAASAVEYFVTLSTWNGNTCFPLNDLIMNITSNIDISSETLRDAVTSLVFDGVVQLDVVDGQKMIYKYNYYKAEKNSAFRIAELAKGNIKKLTNKTENMIESIEKEVAIEYSDGQKTAIDKAINRGAVVITGGPGTGKTTIINAVIRIFKDNGLNVKICAPTGRAAKRIEETSGYRASTIHRLLEYSFSDSDENMEFGRDSENPLDCDAVIVDEASMIDLLLMDALLTAIKPGTRLILAGDSDQLPPVGAGNVLIDIIRSDLVEVVELKEIFRQAQESLIVVNAHRINKGEFPSLNQKDSDFFFMDRDKETQMKDLITELASGRLSAYYEGLDPVEDIQVLTPLRKGILGTGELNKSLQEALNPPSPEKPEKKHGGIIFRLGDKVMQIKNNYELVWTGKDDDSQGTGVFNGDSGIISSVDKENGKVTVLFDGDRYVTYDYKGLDELEPAYAVTVHKSQGNEFPVIIMPISWCPPMLATRNLIYTAITRGKKLVVLVGSRRQLAAMIGNNRTQKRYSGLGKRLEGYVNPQGELIYEKIDKTN